MDPLEITYDSMESVPEVFRELYEERDGKAVLSKVNGLKTQQDVLNVQEGLRKERGDHTSTREELKKWKNLGEDPSEIQSKLDRIAELEVAAAGKLDEDQLTKMVEARLGQKTAPLERQVKEAMTNMEALKNENEKLKNSIQHRDMTDSVRSVATEMKVLSTAIPDVEMVASHYLERDQTSGEFIVKADVKGVTPGADVRTFMKEMQRIRPHWWPQSQGGGAGGGGGGIGGEDNPFSSKSWNVTKQGQIIREHGSAEAEKLAKAAGTTVGGPRPK